jgi:hypothetical protein
MRARHRCARMKKRGGAIASRNRETRAEGTANRKPEQRGHVNWKASKGFSVLRLDHFPADDRL